MTYRSLALVAALLTGCAPGVGNVAPADLAGEWTSPAASADCRNATIATAADAHRCSTSTVSFVATTNSATLGALLVGQGCVSGGGGGRATFRVVGDSVVFEGISCTAATSFACPPADPDAVACAVLSGLGLRASRTSSNAIELRDASGRVWARSR